MKVKIRVWRWTSQRQRWWWNMTHQYIISTTSRSRTLKATSTWDRDIVPDTKAKTRRLKRDTNDSPSSPLIFVISFPNSCSVFPTSHCNMSANSPTLWIAYITCVVDYWSKCHTLLVDFCWSMHPCNGIICSFGYKYRPLQVKRNILILDKKTWFIYQFISSKKLYNLFLIITLITCF